MKDSLTTTYDSAKSIIRKNLESMSKKFITIGYYLKYIRDNELYKQDSFADIWEFAQNTYGISKSTCSRWMSMNDKFSKGGNSPYLKEEFQSFGKSQLQEMLYLTDEQMEQAKPEMTAKKIREIRKPEELSAYGTKKKIYPEGSLLTTKGCEGGHDCFNCGMECNIRQEDRDCWEAPMGNPFLCTTMNTLENLKQELGSKCQFINQKLAYHRPGDGEAVPCCKKCENPCGYECSRSSKCRVQLPGQQSFEEDYPEFLPDKTTEDAGHCTGEVVISEKKEEHTDCPPGISDCIRQQWGTSSDEQHEGQKECAKCWKNWKKLHAAVEKEDSVAPSQQEEQRMISPVSETEQENVEVEHFTKAGRESYGWSWSELVNDYLKAAYQSEIKSAEIESYGRKYQVLKREKVTVFYDAKGKTLFDIENERLDEEYEYLFVKEDSEVESVAVVQQSEVEEEKEGVLSEKTDLELAQEMLRKENKMLDDMLECFTGEDYRVRKQKIKVGALAAMICDLKQPEIVEPKQPELPVMKNNEQRKEWLRDYKSWGLWYEDTHIGARYYRYEFDNGAALIAEEYHTEGTEYCSAHTSCYLHLVGGPEPQKGKYGIGKWTHHKVYSRYPDNETQLVEFLKEVQKK